MLSRRLPLVVFVQPSPMLLLAGLGMMAIGLLPIIYWHRKTGAAWKVFGIGAVSWLSAILAKAVMDIYLTSSVATYLQTFGAVSSSAALGVYFGVRTGIFENGFSFMWARRMQLRRSSFDEAVAFGIGFAGVEALGLGLSSFLNILLILIYPSLMTQLPSSTLELLSAQFSLGPVIVGAPIIERCSTLLIHSFAATLVFATLNGNGWKFFWGAVAYKSIVDGVIPSLNLFLSSSTLSGLYFAELPFVLLALMGYLGMTRLRDNEVLTRTKGPQLRESA